MANVAWIASYPKSGNTWLRFMLTRYLTGKVPTSNDGNAVPALDELLRSGDALNLDGEGPVLAKTHFLPSRRVMQLYRPTSAKAVYIVRNPRDVLLSSIRHYGITEQSAAHDFAKSFIANDGVPMWRDDSGMGSWPEHVRDWSEPDAVRKYMPDIEVHTVRYEDLRNDPAGNLYRIVSFLDFGRYVDEEEIKKTVADTSIENMRSLNIVSIGRIPQKIRGPRPGGGAGGPGGGGGQGQPVIMRKEGGQGPAQAQGGQGGGQGQPVIMRKEGGQGQPVVMRRPEGQAQGQEKPATPFGEPGKLVGEGRTNQSLRHLGDDIEEAYQALLHESGEFARVAAKFGYVD